MANSAFSVTGSGGGGGGYSLISSQTIVSQATIPITNLTNVYSKYIITLINFTMSTNAILNMRFSTNNGVSYDSGANYDWQTVQGNGASAATNHNFGDSSNFLIGTVTTPNIVSGDINLFGIGQTFPLTLTTLLGVPQNQTITAGCGYYNNSSTPVNALQLFNSAGALMSGIVNLYGIT